MDVSEITEPGDPRVDEFARMRDSLLRDRLAGEHGAFLAEGLVVVERALRAGHRLRRVLTEPRYVAELASVLDGRAPGVPVHVAERPVLRAITGYPEHPGPLGTFDRPAPAAVGDVLAAARRVVVLEDTVNPTNMGVLFRCAAGLGMDAVLLTPGCTDPLYRRSVRASMGEIFAIPWARLDSWPDGLAVLRSTGFALVAMTPGEGSVALDAYDPSGVDRLAVLLGTEGPGLSAAALAAADVRLSIPMARGVDSLNVGAAAAVAFWHLGRRRTS
ncbi:MAG: TrmH family RNA methyltransferase [Frankiaceae bacterium]